VFAGFSAVAVAGPFDAGESVLQAPAAEASKAARMPPAPGSDAARSDAAVAAPKMNPQLAAPEIDAPITDGVVVQASEQADPHVYHHQDCPHCQRRRQAKKESFFDKLMDMERKKNAWLKRTFLGM